MPVVYVAVNKLNRKRYVGVTSRSLTYRRKRHLFLAAKGGSQCPRLYDAIRKHGAENFDWFMVEHFDHMQDALAYERKAFRVLSGGAINYGVGE